VACDINTETSLLGSSRPSLATILRIFCCYDDIFRNTSSLHDRVCVPTPPIAATSLMSSSLYIEEYDEAAADDTDNFRSFGFFGKVCFV